MSRKAVKRKTPYTEKELTLAVELYRELRDPIEIFYHLMQSRRIESFSIILIKTKYNFFGNFLKSHKRDSDMIILSDSENGNYVLLCQETLVDGGYRFAERLRNDLRLSSGSEFRAAVVAVEYYSFPVKELVLTVVDMYRKLLENDNENHILHRSIR